MYGYSEYKYFLNVFEFVTANGGKVKLKEIPIAVYYSTDPVSHTFFDSHLPTKYKKTKTYGKIMQLEKIDGEYYVIAFERKVLCNICNNQLFNFGSLDTYNELDLINKHFKIAHLEYSDIIDAHEYLDNDKDFYFEGICDDCGYKPFFNLKEIKKPNLNSYGLSETKFKELQIEKGENAVFPKLGIIDSYFNKERIEKEYYDKQQNWKKNNENYFLYISQIIKWFHYQIELEKYKHSKLSHEEKTKEKAEKIRLQKSEQFWSSIDGHNFEKRIGELFSNLGHKIEFTPATGDQGVDLFVDKDTVVQCKAHESQISPSVIREMYGSMMHFKKKKAIVISTGGFTKGCYDFAKGKPIELWDLYKIIEKAKSIRR